MQDINLSETDLDSKGRAFETFMGSFFRGDFGQYFTPRPIVKFIVDALPITHTSRVLDTSCGSGGFLLHALDKVRREADGFYAKNTAKDAAKHWTHWHTFAEKNLFGIEINEQIARTAKMNMIIHDDGHTNVVAADGLLMPDDLAVKTKNKEFKADSFDFIITNPPFGSVVRQTEQAYLHNYKLASKEVDWLNPKSLEAKRPGQDTEILFIEQCHRYLVEGGYLAMVIVSIMEVAYAEKKQLEAQAAALLSSIDGYLLTELGIALPTEPENTIANRIFTVRMRELAGWRFDPQALHPEREACITEIQRLPSHPLHKAASLCRDLRTDIPDGAIYVGLENIESNTGRYLPSSDKGSVSSAFAFRKGQVLFPKLRPYLNKVFLAPFDGLCSTELHVLEGVTISSELAPKPPITNA